MAARRVLRSKSDSCQSRAVNRPSEGSFREKAKSPDQHAAAGEIDRQSPIAENPVTHECLIDESFLEADKLLRATQGWRSAVVHLGEKGGVHVVLEASRSLTVRGHPEPRHVRRVQHEHVEAATRIELGVGFEPVAKTDSHEKVQFVRTVRFQTDWNRHGLPSDIL